MATVNPIPNFTVTDPLPVVYPVQTIDITIAKNATQILANGTSEDKQKVIADVITSS